MKPLPLKIQDVNRQSRFGVVVSSLADLFAKGRKKLHIDEELDEDEIRICLETDGTQIHDDDFLRYVPANSVVVFLLPNEDWTGYWSYIMNAFEEVKKIHPLYQVKQRIEKTLDFEKDPDKLSTISTFLNSLDNKREADSRKDDPDWFEDLSKTAKSKEQVMKNGAKSRIRGYFYAAKKAVQTSVSPKVYSTTFSVVFQEFSDQLGEDDFYAGLFGRNCPEVRLCDETGWFNCEGPFDAQICPKSHLINPYDNKESRIVFSTWNLDHQIEKSRSVIPGLLQAAQNVPKNARLHWEYFYGLLFTKINLRLVHIACHKKFEHEDKQMDEKKFYVHITAQKGRNRTPKQGAAA